MGLFIFKQIKQKSLGRLRNIEKSERVPVVLVIFIYWFDHGRNPSESWKLLCLLC